MMKMPRFHLIITIFNPFFQWKLNARWKIESVWFEDYDYFFEKILSDLTINEINKMKLKLFEACKYDLSRLKVCEFINGDCLNWYLIPTTSFNIPADIIARCVPSRWIRDKYFDYYCFKEKYYVKSDFIYYLKW